MSFVLYLYVCSLHVHMYMFVWACTLRLFFVFFLVVHLYNFLHYNRTEQVYRFFQQWCPNIHNATDEESDDDITSSGCCAPDEEVNIVDSTLCLYVAVRHSRIATFLSTDFASTFLKFVHFFPQGLHLVETFYSNSPPSHSRPIVSKVSCKCTGFVLWYFR